MIKEAPAIQERQVTVKVLTMGTKQVTQSFYKQLPEEEVIFNDDGNLQGKVWGWVNLHIDCCDKGPHLHAIWEEEGVLKRSHTLYSYDSLQHHFLRRELRDLSTLYVCLVALAGKSFNHWRQQNYTSVLPLTIKGQRVDAYVPDFIQRIFDAPPKIEELKKQLTMGPLQSLHGPQYHQQQLDVIIEDVKKTMAMTLRECLRRMDSYQWTLDNPEQYTSYDEVYEQMEHTADEINTYEQNWRKSYKAIEDAGQLFIAVSGVWK